MTPEKIKTLNELTQSKLLSTSTVDSMDVNTFGNSFADKSLVSFLNSLKEPEYEAKKIRRKVGVFIHELNKDIKNILDLFYQSSKTSVDNNFKLKILALMEADYKKRLQQQSWRSYIKTAVHSCIKNRFTELRKH